VKSNGLANGNGKHNATLDRVRCAIYTRKSIERGLDQEFNSLDAQREACAAYIAAHRAAGWLALPESYEDGGFSGGTTDRPAWQRLMRDVEAGQVDLIVVYRVDRLTRSLRDFVTLIDFLDKHGARFASVTENFDTSTPSGRAFLTMLMTFAQLERETIAARTRDKVAAARRKGRWTGGFVPLGYDLKGGKLIVNARELLQVQAIFELYLQHGSLSATLRELRSRRWHAKAWTNGNGKKSGGAAFTRSGLYTLLTNPVYIGQVKLDGEAFPGEHQPIVEQGIWDQVQRRFQSNGFKRAAASRNEHGAFLKGILYCAHCDARMIHSSSRKGTKHYRYYVCGKAQREGWHACPVKSVPAGAIEAAVLQEIRDASQDPALVRETWQEVVRQRKERIRELEREVRIEEAEGNGRLMRAQEELAALKEAALSEDDLASCIQEFAPLWDALTYAEQAQVAASLIDRVDYDDSEITLRFRGNERG
jgi:site-specific DNA recombinase